MRGIIIFSAAIGIAAFLAKGDEAVAGAIFFLSIPLWEKIDEMFDD